MCEKRQQYQNTTIQDQAAQRKPSRYEGMDILELTIFARFRHPGRAPRLVTWLPATPALCDITPSGRSGSVSEDPVPDRWLRVDGTDRSNEAT
ncbi:MAG TPA: hypothetical protein VMV17_24985 [Streptosporangiaceae bacterium]|nr:hypothetical protein [Streptosporangiaceae bacterium]